MVARQQTGIRFTLTCLTQNLCFHYQGTSLLELGRCAVVLVVGQIGPVTVGNSVENGKNLKEDETFDVKSALQMHNHHLFSPRPPPWHHKSEIHY